jgi:hypothetical protein
MDETEQQTAVRADCGLNYISAPDPEWGVSFYGVGADFIPSDEEKS